MTQTNTDKTVAERLREQGVEVLRRLSSAKVSLSDASFIAGWATEARAALASRTQEPAEWQVEAARGVIWPATEWPEGEVYCRDVAANALRAASITPPAPERSKEEVGVKPLEWAELTSPREDGPPEPTGDVEAVTMIGEYSVCFDSDEDVSETPWCCWGPNENIGHFADPSEAKAAAQADYEQRILSALEPASLHKGEVEPVFISRAFDPMTAGSFKPVASPAPLPVGEEEALLALIREEAGKDNSPLGRSDSLAIRRIRTALGLDPHSGASLSSKGA